MYASSRLSRTRSATVMAVVASVTVLLAVFAVGAAAHNGRGDRHGSIRQDQISIQLFNFLVPIYFCGLPAPQPAALDRADAGQYPRCVCRAAPHRQAHRRFENFGGTWGWSDTDYRNVFRSYKLQAVGDHGSLDPATFDARLDQAKTLGLKHARLRRLAASGNMDMLENA